MSFIIRSGIAPGELRVKPTMAGLVQVSLKHTLASTLVMAKSAPRKPNWLARQPVAVRAALVGSCGAIIAALLAAMVTLIKDQRAGPEILRAPKMEPYDAVPAAKAGVVRLAAFTLETRHTRL